VAHYASSVFEGIRCYDTPRGAAIFRLEEHLDRLMHSARIYRMEMPFTREQIRQACLEVVAVNELKACYLRPLIYRGYENLGVNPFGSPVEVAVAAFPWGKYLGDDALTKGVAVKVSSWWRISPNTLPAMAKASANYMNSQLMKMERWWTVTTRRWRSTSTVSSARAADRTCSSWCGRAGHATAPQQHPRPGSRASR
jgi:branched-chain amino acid aminotransferase